MNKNIISRQEIRKKLFERIESNSISLSETLKLVRKVINKNQKDYAQLVGVSKKIIADIELNRGNPTLNTINKLFAPIGLEVGLVRRK